MTNKLIEDMARGIEEQFHDRDKFKNWDDMFTAFAKAALDTLPEFIVLEVGAEPEVGDLVLRLYNIEPPEVFIYIENGAFGFCPDGDKIIQRNGTPVIYIPRGKQGDDL